MGLGSWIFGSSNSDLSATHGEEVRTMTADTDKEPMTAEESQTSRTEKLVLYAYLGLLSLIWYDIYAYFLGWWGELIITSLIGYITILCWPAKVGKWDIKDRMQIRSVLIIHLSTITGLFGCPLWMLFIADKRWFPFVQFGVIRTCFFLYVVWYLFLDTQAAKTGARYFPGLRRRRFWKHLAEYFPIKLTRTKRLDPEKNYIFGYHPHGIISVGACTNFGTFATGFDKLFPGIDLRTLTLATNFLIPIVREYFLAMGINDASKESITYNLSQKGRSVLLVIGGAAESLNTEVATNDLILEHRKGFVKMALKTGASLVPVFSFGENDIYLTVPFVGRWKALQLSLQKKMGFAIPMFFGRALTGGLAHRLFGIKVGLFPFRMPIHSVVGSPIEVPKMQNEDITQEVIDKYHRLYCAELTKIHDEWKPGFEEEKKKRIAELEEDKDRQKILGDKKFESLKKEGKNLEIK